MGEKKKNPSSEEAREHRHHHRSKTDEMFLAALRKPSERPSEMPSEQPSEMPSEQPSEMSSAMKSQEQSGTSANTTAQGGQTPDRREDEPVDESYFGALSKGRTRSQHKQDIKNQFHHYSKEEREKTDKEFFGALAKKSPKDHLQLFALDGMRASLPFIRAAIAAIVILRLMLITMSVIFGRYYVSRQIVYTVAWVTILAFALTYQPNVEKINDIKIYINRMRIISLLAAIACALKSVITLIYNWDMFAIQAWMTAYSVLEIAAWFALSVFFLMFWKYWNHQRSNIHYIVQNYEEDY